MSLPSSFPPRWEVASGWRKRLGPDSVSKKCRYYGRNWNSLPSYSLLRYSLLSPFYITYTKLHRCSELTFNRPLPLLKVLSKHLVHFNYWYWCLLFNRCALKVALNDLGCLPGGVPHGFYYFAFLAILSTLLGKFIFPYNGERRVVATPHHTGAIWT